MKTIQQIREASGGKEAYQKFFNSILKKFGVDSPSELKGDKKKEFFDAIDKGWDGDNEKAESVSEASNLKGGRGKAEIDINWLGSSGDAKFISTKYKIKIKKTSNGAILSGDKQKILAYLQGKEYDMDAEDIKDLYPELVETYDDPDDYESEKDVTLNPDEDPLATGKSLGEANSALLKKAQAIASKLSGNMTKAVAEIEKLKKGLSDDKKVMAMLKTANEDISEAKTIRLNKPEKTIFALVMKKATKDRDVMQARNPRDIERYMDYGGLDLIDDIAGVSLNDDSLNNVANAVRDELLKGVKESVSEAHVRAVDFEKTSKEIGKLKHVVDQNAIKQIAKYFNVMFKNSSLKIRDDAVLAVNKLKSKLSRDTRVEIDKILTTNNLMKNGNIMVEGAMKKNPAIDNNPEVKAARKAHAAGDWDGNVDKNGEAIVHIKGKPYTVTNNNESVSEAKKLKAGRGKATIDVNWTGGNDGVKDAFKKHKIKIKPTSNGAIITGDKKGILDFLSGTWYDMDTDDIEDLYPELMESIARVTLVNEAIKVFAKKSGYVFYKDTVKDIAMLSYKGKVISSGDFDQGADGWFMELHQRGMEGQKFFSTGEDVIKFFMKNKITEAVSVDRRTMGFKEAMKRRAEAKAKREAMKIKAAKKQAKNDMASIDANYAYDGDIEEILASANKKIMGEDAAANASSSGAVDMNPTGKNKKDKKESPMAKYGY